MDSKNRHRTQTPASLRPSVSSTDYVMFSAGEPSLRQLTNPAFTGIVKDNNDVSFKLIKTGKSSDHISR